MKRTQFSVGQREFTTEAQKPRRRTRREKENGAEEDERKRKKQKRASEVLLSPLFSSLFRFFRPLLFGLRPKVALDPLCLRSGDFCETKPIWAAGRTARDSEVPGLGRSIGFVWRT